MIHLKLLPIENVILSGGVGNVKWFMLQILTLGAIGILLAALEIYSANRIVNSSAEWMPVNNVYATFIIVAVVISCFYLIFWLEGKKVTSIFERPFWTIMPQLIITVGILSIILFLVGGTLGPIMNWVEQWRSLLYIFLIYFLFLIFLFIFSLEHKKHRNKTPINKTIFTSYIWTIVLFIVVFFIF
jgi:hypothetical protein